MVCVDVHGNTTSFVDHRSNISVVFFFCRTIKSSRKVQSNPARCIVDGELIWTYLDLPYCEKMEVARKIGTKMDELLADLLEIERTSSTL